MASLTFANKDQMPVIGLGTWKISPSDVGKVVIDAIQSGYRHLDCAAIYGNETAIGEALEDCFHKGWLTRDELWVTSKLWNNAHSKKHVTEALHKTLLDLRLDYIDLYLVHWPVATKPDVIFPRSGEDFVELQKIPLTETWSGMEDCVSSGLARHIGVSNFNVGHLENVTQKAAIQPEMNQVEMHPYLQQPKLYDYCHKQGILLTAYSPLGSGDRPDIMKKPDELSLLNNPVVRRIADSLGCTTAQVLIRWAVERGVSVIPKSSNRAHLKENLKVLELKLSAKDMKDLAQLDCGFRYVHGEFFTIPGSPYSLEMLWGAA